MLPEYAAHGVQLPRRASSGSAGYDIAAAAPVTIPPQAVALVPTGLCVRMPRDEFLALHVRSGLAVRRGLMLANGTGVVDSDYVGNTENGGHILVALFNWGRASVRVERGERIAQGIFVGYRVVDEDQPGHAARVGGFGSTGAASLEP